MFTKELIRQLADTAYDMSYHVLQHAPHKGHNDFVGLDYSKTPDHELFPNGSIRYQMGSPHSYIWFSDFRPRKINGVKLEQAQELNSRIEDINSISVRNDTDADIQRTYEFNREESSTKEMEINNSITTALKATFGTGMLSTYKVEVEVKTEITTEVNLAMSSTVTNGKSDSMTVIIPKRSSVDVVSQRKLANFRQRVNTDCELDFTVRIYSNNDWDRTYESRRQFIDTIQGLTADNSYLEQHWKNKPSSWNFDDKKLTLVLETEVSFDNATTGNITATQKDL